MDTPSVEDQILSVLRNIELNTAQRSPTPQNVDAIVPLSFPLNPSYQVTTVAFTNSEVQRLLNTEKFSFDIPSEAPHILVPECARSLALYRNNDLTPFAFIQTGQSRSFVIPHLERLTVEVLPGYESGNAVIYASSRPLTVDNAFSPSRAITAIPFGTYGTGMTFSYVVPVVSSANLSYAFIGISSSGGATNVELQVYGIDETQLQQGRFASSVINLTPLINNAAPFNEIRNVLLNPPRYVLFSIRVTPSGSVDGFLSVQMVN